MNKILMSASFMSWYTKVAYFRLYLENRQKKSKQIFIFKQITEMLQQGIFLIRWWSDIENIASRDRNNCQTMDGVDLMLTNSN